MGKACLMLMAMILALAVFPKNEVSGASLENPLKDRPDEFGSDILGDSRDRGDEEYDYDFLNQHPYGGGYPRGLRNMQRHERLMKRLRRHAMGDQSPFPPSPEG